MPARKRAPAPKPDDPEEYRRFVETARELGADESPEAMDRAFERVVKPKVHHVSPEERRAISAEVARSRPPRTAAVVRDELARAEVESARADRAEDNYDGNNPGKLTRLQRAAREARAIVQSLKAELVDLKG